MLEFETEEGNESRVLGSWIRESEVVRNRIKRARNR